MEWRVLRNLTLLFVILSIIADAIIIAFDGLLARYGGTLVNLEGVVAIYAILAVLLLAKPPWGLPLTLLVSALWFSGQIVNAFGSGPPNVTFLQGFTGYIFGYGAIPPNAAVGCPYGCPPFTYSALFSIIYQIPGMLFAFLGWTALRRNKTQKAISSTT